MNKPTSPLFRLPAELRTKIYSLVLGGHVIHIGGTSHQPYGDGDLPDGKCCCCTANLSDEDCFAKYTLQSRPLIGKFPLDRFSRRHRDCYRYPVSHRLQLNFLLVCKQIHREAASLVFEENTFTLARPYSFGPFLARLRSWQLSSIRTLRVYSVESRATWIGPFNNYHLAEYLTGLLRLHVFIEVKPYDVSVGLEPYGHLGCPEALTISSMMNRRMAGLAMFKVPSLNRVEVMIVTPDWKNVQADDLSNFSLEVLREWETSIKRNSLPS